MPPLRGGRGADVALEQGILRGRTGYGGASVCGKGFDRGGLGGADGTDAAVHQQAEELGAVPREGVDVPGDFEECEEGVGGIKRRFPMWEPCSVVLIAQTPLLKGIENLLLRHWL